MTRLDWKSVPWRIAFGAALLWTGTVGSLLAYGSLSGSVAEVRQQQRIIQGTMRDLGLAELGTRRFEFTAGSRLYWHTHNRAPQLLMMESGKGRVQDRGGPVIELLPNQPFLTPAGVEHWHGAAPDEGGVQWNIYDGLGVAGTVTWGDSVSTADYNASAMRLAPQAFVRP